MQHLCDIPCALLVPQVCTVKSMYSRRADDCAVIQSSRNALTRRQAFDFETFETLHHRLLGESESYKDSSIQSRQAAYCIAHCTRNIFTVM
jgi:hypothetical protein